MKRLLPLVLLATSLWGAAANVNHAMYSNNASTTTIALSYTSTTGNMVYVGCTGYAGGGWLGQNSSVSDTGVNTFTRDTQADSGGIYTSVHRAYISSGGTRTITCTFSQVSTAKTIYITEWSGMDNTAPVVDTTGGSNGTGTNTSVSLITANAADLLIVMTAIDSGVITISGAGSTTVRDSQPDGNNYCTGASGDLVVAATGTYPVGFTITSSPWVTAAVAYKATSAGGPRRRQVVIE